MAYEPSPAVLQTTFASPAGTTSTSPQVMLGLGATTSFAIITPQVTGRVFVSISGLITNVNGDGGQVQLSYGTGAAPVAGASLTGTQIGLKAAWISLTGALTGPFSLQALITGLAVPTFTSAGKNGTQVPVWLDLAFNATTAGTCTITNVNISAFEV